MTQQQDKFTPQNQPLSAEELAEYTEDGEEVLIRRGDVERAIATADESLQPYLKAAQYKPKND